ncbi:hypothetical protein PVAND_000519 [Polypedilum vanderplanki]|uniref:Uncharacterized protein n=1 Tax=Polypedilum vanderplanki TaxID=319348 RepID=A0A9J6BKG1_POLVA|nr:hypothetical protein PVAND_000519 [Polypedilum vanderplanki]
MLYHGDHPSIGIYFASKYAVTAIAEQHRQEFIKEKLNIKVTEAVMTEMVNATPNYPQELMDELIKNTPFLESKDIADAIYYF